jgi:hypothetical protein
MWAVRGQTQPNGCNTGWRCRSFRTKYNAKLKDEMTANCKPKLGLVSSERRRR